MAVLGHSGRSKSTPKSRQERAKMPPRALVTPPRAPNELPRCFQELQDQILEQFGPQDEAAGPQNLLKFIEKSMIFQYFLRCSSLVTKCSCSSVSKPLGPPLGAVLAPNRPPGGPQQLPKRLQDGSRTLQDASRTAPGAPQASSKSPKEPSTAAKKPPRGPRDPPGVDLDLPGGPLGLDFHPPNVSKLGAPGNSR